MHAERNVVKRVSGKRSVPAIVDPNIGVTMSESANIVETWRRPTAMADMVGFPVTELGPADHVDVGEQAPDFTRPLVNDEYWEDVSLSDLLGEVPVVLVFHPMDGDFPSTYYWNEIRDREWGDHATVVGCSISSPYEHKRFIEERRMDYRLFSDPGNGVAEAYSIAHELDGMAGISEPRPSVFVVDRDGTIEYAWVSTKWPELPDYDEIEAVIERR